ncbi:MAG: hypothetical protein ACERKN_17165 [Velocimicrobium sp.]
MKFIVNKRNFIVFALAAIFIIICCTQTTNCVVEDKKTIIFSTDLLQNGDFDDYFDLIAMKSLKNINLKVILDGNEQSGKNSGGKSINNLDYITKEKTSYIIGLDKELISKNDTGKNSTKKNRDNNDKILDIIRKAKGKVTIVTVGSLRDVAASYNKNSKLFQAKVDKIYVFAGDYEGTYLENNVALDEYAYLDIMNSGLPIYWIPCFENGLWTKGNNASYLTVKHSELFSCTKSDLFKWFMYRFYHENGNFKVYLKQTHDSKAFLNETRNLWCSPILSILDGSYNTYVEDFNKKYNRNIDSIFDFEEIKAKFSKGGKVDYGDGNKIMKVKIKNHDEYTEVGKYIISEMIKEVEKTTTQQTVTE